MPATIIEDPKHWETEMLGSQPLTTPVASLMLTARNSGQKEAKAEKPYCCIHFGPDIPL